MPSFTKDYIFSAIFSNYAMPYQNFVLQSMPCFNTQLEIIVQMYIFIIIFYKRDKIFYYKLYIIQFTMVFIVSHRLLQRMIVIINYIHEYYLFYLFNTYIAVSQLYSSKTYNY